jgi:hypothetical protein
MGAWAGADTLQLVAVSTRIGVDGQLQSATVTREVPGMASVQFIEDGAAQAACGLYEARQLTRLDRPWERWQPAYRCRRCYAQHPDV